MSESRFTQPDIHDMLDELTRAHRHRERYAAKRAGETWTSQHITDVPALVHQLLGATPAGSGSESGSTSAKSRPAARIEAIDTLMLIDHEASAWIRRLGENDPGDTLEIVRRQRGPSGPVCDRRCVHHSCITIRRGEHIERRRIAGSGTIACLRKLHGLHASATHCGRAKPKRSKEGRPTCCPAHHIEHDVRRWWHQARIITGWDTAAYRPYNTCPVCDQRGGLRINLAMHAGLCIECRSVWGADEIGLLAEHIRTENADDDATPVAEGA